MEGAGHDGVTAAVARQPSCRPQRLHIFKSSAASATHAGAAAAAATTSAASRLDGPFFVCRTSRRPHRSCPITAATRSHRPPARFAQPFQLAEWYWKGTGPRHRPSCISIVRRLPSRSCALATAVKAKLSIVHTFKCRQRRREDGHQLFCQQRRYCRASSHVSSLNSITAARRCRPHLRCRRPPPPPLPSAAP